MQEVLSDAVSEMAWYLLNGEVKHIAIEMLNKLANYAISCALWYCFKKLSDSQHCTLELPSGSDWRSLAKSYLAVGLKQFLMKSCSLRNAPAILKCLMEHVLSGLSWKTCVVYLDDIIVYNKPFQEHTERLREVFERLYNNQDSIIKLSKVCSSWATCWAKTVSKWYHDRCLQDSHHTD